MSNLAGRATNSYLQTEVQSRSPLELVVMLYDGALKFIGAARSALERNDIRARGEALSRALAIISELQSTLDMDKGGAIAQSLDRLYRHVTDRLMEAAAKRDPRPLDEAIKVLTALREAWSTVSKAGSAAATQAVR